MQDVNNLVKRLRFLQPGKVGDREDAADRIEYLEAECEQLREALDREKRLHKQALRLPFLRSTSSGWVYDEDEASKYD